MTTEGKFRVLIVDDITETRESLKRMLQFDSNIEVIGTARSGKEAIEQSQKIKPDVILMDINMPDMDGITATESIRRKHAYAQVIILSVQNDPDYMRRAMRVGAHDFLPKPPMIDELIEAIQRAGKVAHIERAKIEQEAALEVSVGAKGTGRLKTQGKVIVVYSPKGGVGCTMIATNLALALQSGSKKVTLVDGNMQYGDVPIFMSQQAKNNILDLAPRVDELDEEIVEEVMTKHSASGLHILAAPPRPEMAENLNGEQFGKLLQYFCKLYSYIVVDTSSYLSDIVLSALEQAHYIILITTQDMPAIKNANAFLTLADALGYPRQRIAFTMNCYDKRIGITPERIGESLRQEIVSIIPFDDRLVVSTSIKRGIPLLIENKTHPVSKSILQLASLVRDKISLLDKDGEANL